MSSPLIPVPTRTRSVSQPRTAVRRSPKPSRRDKIRQGRLVKSWTDEEESFLFRSRTQAHKLSYRHIASRLDKTELACRLHYHHMTVGRKSHRLEGEFDDDTLSSDGSTVSAFPSLPPLAAEASHETVRQDAEVSDVIATTIPKPVLPSFESFCRDVYHHRSISMPGSNMGGSQQQATPVPQPLPGGRMLRTLSGTYLRDSAAGIGTVMLQPISSIDALLTPRRELRLFNDSGTSPGTGSRRSSSRAEYFVAR